MRSPSKQKPTDLPELANVSIPQPLANYDVVELANGDIFIPGQGCRDPITDECVGITRGANGAIESYDIREQTLGVFKNIDAILISRGLTRENIVRILVFMKDKKDLDAMNEIWNDYFSDCKTPRARTVTFITDLPRENFIEMEVFASRIPKVV